MNKNDKVALLGLGAIGAPLADRLQEKKPDDFILVADEDHKAKIKKHQIYINGKPLSAAVVSDKTELGGHIWLLFICVKNYSVLETCNTIRKLIDRDTILLPLQNGIYSFQLIKEQFPNNVVLEGFARGPNTKILGADIVYQNPGEYHIGTHFPENLEHAQRVYRFLKEIGVPCTYDEDILCSIWKKMMLNVAGNALTALTELDYSMIKESSEAQIICKKAMKEYVEVAKSQGILITEQDVDETMQYYLTYSGMKHTSMLEDAIHHRRTENEFLAGYIRKLAADNSINVPTIDMLYMLMKIKEEVYMGDLGGQGGRSK